jgi:D-glycero-D-manno-heptose 1,7-bisphosphate phosphatase
VADIFVDRDGVINRNRPDHVKRWSEFEFLSGAVEALVLLTRRGHRTFVVTNQSGVNRGVLPADVAASIHHRMAAEVGHHGGVIEAVLVCPHVPEEGCVCRKPMPGLLLQAQERLGAILEGAYLIGDFSTDLQAAWAAGCTPILVLTGRGRQAYDAMTPEELRRCWVARDLLHAVEMIEHNGPRARTPIAVARERVKV